MSIDPVFKAKAAAEAAAFLAGLTADASGAAAAGPSPEQLPPPGSQSPGSTPGSAIAVPSCSRWQAGLSGMLPPSVKAEPLENGHSLGPGPGPVPPEPLTSGGFAAPQQHPMPHQSYTGTGRRYGPAPGRSSRERPGARREPERDGSVGPHEGPGPCSSALERTGLGPDNSGETLLRFYVRDDLPDFLRGGFSCRAWSYRLQRQVDQEETLPHELALGRAKTLCPDSWKQLCLHRWDGMVHTLPAPDLRLDGQDSGRSALRRLKVFHMLEGYLRAASQNGDVQLMQTDRITTTGPETFQRFRHAVLYLDAQRLQDMCQAANRTGSDEPRCLKPGLFMLRVTSAPRSTATSNRIKQTSPVQSAKVLFPPAARAWPECLTQVLAKRWHSSQIRPSSCPNAPEGKFLTAVQAHLRSRSPLPRECGKVAHRDAAHAPRESREPSAAAPEQPPLSPKRRQPCSPAHADSPGHGASPQRSRPSPELWRVTDWVLAGVEVLARLPHGVLRPRTLQSLAKLPQLYQLGSLTFLYGYQLKHSDLDKALQGNIARFLNPMVPQPFWMRRVACRHSLAVSARTILKAAREHCRWLHESLWNPAQLKTPASASCFGVMQRLPDPLQQAVALAFAGRMVEQGPMSEDHQADILWELARVVKDKWDAVAP